MIGGFSVRAVAATSPVTKPRISGLLETLSANFGPTRTLGEPYKAGFTESAGNFQEDNFGTTAVEFAGDGVLAEAQDGPGFNNANFATPDDGINPRMQMYLWNLSNPRRDGDLDSDIIWHEYGHGLTWRMIGGMSGPLSGAIGEGMGDTLAIYADDNDVVAEYSSNNPIGIRRDPYTNYPRTSEVSPHIRA